MGKVISQSTVRFRCPHCGKMNKAPIAAIGRGGSCAKCGGGVEVPGKAAANLASSNAADVERDETVGAHPAASSVNVIAAEHQPEESPAGPAAAPSGTAQTLEDLAAYLAATPKKRSPGPSTPQQTPWWLWLLHLALPVATLFVVAKITANRMPAPAPPPAKVLPPQPIEPESPARSSNPAPDGG